MGCPCLGQASSFSASDIPKTEKQTDAGTWGGKPSECLHMAQLQGTLEVKQEDVSRLISSDGYKA